MLQGIVIVGHSTGCQDAIRYAERYNKDTQAPPLLGVVLQAPVCCGYRCKIVQLIKTSFC